MENDGKELYKDGDQSEDLSVEYECSSDESDDMMDVTIDESEADIINVNGFEKLITDLTIENIWGLVFDTESQVCEFYAKYAKWSEIISKYGLAENEWVQGIYNDKMKWATAYLREHFFGRIRTTSQCEEIHSLLKNYVDSKTSLLEFMHKFSEVLRHYRNNHLTADFETFYKFSVLTTCLENFKKQAAELYTKNIFKLMKDEIEAAGALNVTECPNSGETLLSTTRVSILISNGNLKYLTIKTRTCLRLCDICSKNSADYREISVIHKRGFPPSSLIGNPAVVKSKGAPKKVPKGQKRRRCSHFKSSRHFVRTCSLLVKEDSPVEYSNAEDEPMDGGSKKSVSKLTETPKIRANGKKKSAEVVHPYQPYGRVLPIPFHPVPNGMAYFNQYPSTAGITSYPQFFHVSSYSSGPSDSNTWAGLLNDVINNKKP
ncbi:hypothetical protein Ahy_A08g037887 [Arachis hypogaea]|uniref:Protein FAR1-RELATED SEQUENCE n=1 Tax=Arachis hypogaea TaxID=3818 RepID=A0A445BS28_ARAHY|nr:hypothetical protein Ahy_A08g037887 [Arachis hypogaea]